jgi:hypothetical protein
MCLFQGQNLLVKGESILYAHEGSLYLARTVSNLLVLEFRPELIEILQYKTKKFANWLYFHVTA